MDGGVVVEAGVRERRAVTLDGAGEVTGLEGFVAERAKVLARHDRG